MRKVTHAQKRYAWADCDELLHRCRGPRRNHLCQLLWLSLMGFERGGGSNFGFLHWLALSPLQHSRTTVRVCDSRPAVWRRYFCTQDLLQRDCDNWMLYNFYLYWCCEMWFHPAFRVINSTEIWLSTFSTHSHHLHTLLQLHTISDGRWECEVMQPGGHLDGWYFDLSYYFQCMNY